MERIIKIFFILLICIIGIPAYSQEPTVQELTTPANMQFKDCTKTYNIPAEKLYYLTLDSISANRFEIKELQSKTGYVVFKAAGREFLATVAYYSQTKSILRITPVNGNYYFPPGIVYNIFKYIDININEEIKPIEKS